MLNRLIDFKNSFPGCQNGSLENLGISGGLCLPYMTYDPASHWLSFSSAVDIRPLKISAVIMINQPHTNIYIKH